ncbi:TetR/AcrR family transcriptional regulator [Amycolatopsis tolypomycina]|uniref:DNA-binding transcriptional regulator, AcrR family n=1 Tax=Amycolatopsis tolypomycina TaxID=208445 RepID=A0A1H4UTT4_9PSEU|nr:TetR/AcrR family transcriptional regulator [Amycolatopsis tolypomycina]SEC71661.1 DNA-binding transcriptional regulator, AcrR family [Amycolatopsis tolypomycina]
MSGPVKRQYDSSRRREQARENRRRILEAAHDLFVTRGYGRTTIADVAERAGVAPETVYAAFKNKPTLLHRAWDVTVGGDDEDVPLLERPELRAVLAEPDLRARFAALAVFNTAAMRRTARLHLAVRGAAASDAAAAAMLAEIDRQRLEGMAEHARAAAATGQLAVAEDECRDVLWSTTDGSLWHQLVEGRGWTDERYAAWLGRLWAATLAG